MTKKTQGTFDCGVDVLMEVLSLSDDVREKLVPEVGL